MHVLIVESAAKGRTLEKYLGKDWRVVATGGHLETLPYDRKEHGKDARKAYWANRSGELPSPPWVFTERGEKALERIREAGGDEPVWYIATDPDREGEFIAWSLARHLEGTGPVHRVTFQEVTEEAVKAAVASPGDVDQAAVESALVRKFVDRLVGFRASKMAQRFVKRGASMGRVQTPTLGFVVERELEREAFVPTPYFEVRVRAEEQGFDVRFHESGDDAAWRDDKGKFHAGRTFDADLAETAFEALQAADHLELTEVSERRNRPRQPRAPLTTDQLLQTGGSLLGWSLAKTSALTSQLYEAGHITYVRTDSTRLAASAVKSARKVIADIWGKDELGAGGSGSGAEKGNVQDAHEAIRPTRLEVDEAPVDDDDARRLYRLIRSWTLASQMKPSRSRTRTVTAACPDLERPLVATVSWRTELGWEQAMSEFEPARPNAPPELPFEEGARWSIDPSEEEHPNPVLIEDETRPPARYRPHSLVKAMKDAEIGRPSTYGRTVDKLEERGYVEVDEGQLVPTEAGRAVWADVAPLYAQTTDQGIDAELFSTEYTAEMEKGLDALAGGTASAPERWETWRDQVRDLHMAALAQRDSGDSTPKQRRTLERLLENAPPALVAEVGSLEELSYQEARDLQRRLREEGVQPAPSEKQLDYIQSLLDDLQLGDDELGEHLPEGSVEAVKTSGRASEIIDELKALHDERRPASKKQRSFIDDLIEEAGLSEAEAAALVGVDDLDELTGGSEGSASALIEALKARTEKASA